MPTTKPNDFYVKIQPRTDFPEPSATPLQTSTKPSESSDGPKPPNPESMVQHIASQTLSAELPSVTFLFGTQTGTAQDYASQLAGQARAFGFKDVKLQDMDDWELLKTGKYEMKKSGPQDLVVIVTATYNGQPPDHGEKFDKFITAKANEEGHQELLYKLKYAVFGVGNKNWRTYQAFPRKVSSSFLDFGAEQLFLTGEGNADKDIDADFNEW